MKRLVGYFLRGSLVLTPLAATLYILYFVFTTIDQLLPIGIPGIGFVVTIVLVTAVGFLTSNVLGRTLFDSAERFFTRLPLVKLVYSSVRDLIGAFVGDRKSFDRPVAVTLVPGSELKALGFITRDGLHGLGMADYVAVYFPQSYNFAGNLMIVPREYVDPLDVPTPELMTFIVSGGVSGLGVGQTMPPASIRIPHAAR
ncbi:MAG TPA: DUF502 domain-containing protein [Polyangiaceae bacterium]